MKAEEYLCDNYGHDCQQLKDCAEISFKSGIKEVVEWIEAQRVASVTLIEGVGYGIAISEEKLQAKLKELGI